MNIHQKPIKAATAVLPTSRKKRIESQYTEEARRASPLIPPGELVPQESPDFLLHADGRIVGIEVTELCRGQQRAEGGKLSNVADRARDLYSRFADASPIDVSAAFAPDTENVGLHQLTKGLANFVHAKRPNHGCSFDWNDCDLPEGYCYVAIHPARQPIGHWRTIKCFHKTLALREFIESCIVEKNRRLPDYRRKAGEVWLLIVNNQFLGAGEIYGWPDHLAQWRFAFDFEKVLLFSRDLGGGGEVIELQRA